MKKLLLVGAVALVFAGFASIHFVTLRAQNVAMIELFALIGEQKTGSVVSSIAGVAEQEIRINFEGLDLAAAEKLRIPLLDGTTYEAVRNQSEGFVRLAPDEVSWRGKIVTKTDWRGDVILTVKDRAMSGLIYAPSGVYEIVPQKDFRHLLVKLDQSRFPKESHVVVPGESDAIPIDKKKDPANEGFAAELVPNRLADSVLVDDGSMIDVMVTYTVPVRNALGGTTQAQAFAQQAVSTANTAYQNSNITTRLRLVRTMEVNYADNGAGLDALNWLTNDPTVAAARNSSGADMVSILTENATEACGVAWLMTSVGPSFENHAFAQVQRTCAVGNLSYPHEHGHNQACDHNPENANPPANLAYPYAYGHWVAAGAFRTVMSYADPCPTCNRVPYFSNPLVTFNGFATGITNGRDNHRVINNTALTVAQFRQSVTGATPTPSPSVTPSLSPTPTPTCGNTYTASTSSGASIVPATSMVAGSNCDDCSVAISLPFTFRLYGQPFTTVNAISNGNLQFGSSDTSFTNTCLPFSAMNYAILPHWDDMLLTGAGQGIFTSTSGSAPNRIFNIRWIGSYFSGGGTAEFEARLYETNQIDLIYGALAQAGSSATIGLQKDTGSVINQFSCNTSSVTAGLKVAYIPAGCSTPIPTPTPSPTPGITPTPPPGTIYNQNNGPGSISSSAQEFPDNPSFNDFLADDFVVPSGQTWTINGVDASGIYFNGSGPADNFNIYFYQTGGSLPGALLASRGAQPYVNNAGLFQVSLSSPVVLGAGTYWISVQAHMSFGTGGQWGWTDRTTQTGSAAAWQNPNGGFGFCPSWGVRQTCLTSPAGEPDQMYSLRGTIGGGGSTPTPTPSPLPGVRTPFDFDGDHRTDISVWRSAAGQWWLNRSTAGTSGIGFGSPGDIPRAADYTGDGVTDVAFFRPATNQWFILRSENFTYYAFPFGASGDISVTGDFDGDGRSDAAVYRPSATTWFILRSSGGVSSVPFGVNGDIPVPADYDGDGRSDVAIYRPGPGQWWILKSSNQQVFAATFGNSADKPVPGDYTGDGRADLAFFRPSEGNWYVIRSENFTYYAFPWGAGTDKPAPGDYDGDGRFDAAVFRPSDTVWYILRSSGGNTATQFGLSNDTPLPGQSVP